MSLRTCFCATEEHLKAVPCHLGHETQEVLNVSVIALTSK